MSTWLLKCAPPPLHSCMETWLLLYGTVYVSQSPHICSNTLFRMWYIHQYMYLCQHGFQILVHPHCIVTWKCGFPCVTQCVCSSQSTSVPTPHCLECVHASVHVFMLTWLPVWAKPPMDSYMETWVPVCVTVCVPVTLLVVPHLDKSMYIHQYMYTCPPDLQCLFHPFWTVIWKPGCPCVGLWLCLNDPTSVSIPWLEMCTCISTCIHVHLLCMSVPSTNQRWELQSEVGGLVGGGSSSLRWDLHSEVGALIGGGRSDQRWDLQLEVPPVTGGLTSSWSSHLWRSHLQSEVLPQIGAPTTDWLWSHTLVRMCKCISTCIYVHLTAHVCSTCYS